MINLELDLSAVQFSMDRFLCVIQENYLFFIIISKLSVRYTDNVMMFYIRRFFRILYIYYKEKVI